MKATLFRAGGERLRRLPFATLVPALALIALNAPLRGDVARKSEAFIESIGINTHFKTVSPYSVAPGSIHVTRLVESGIRYIRNNRIDVPEVYPGIKTLVAIDVSNLAMVDIMDMLAEPHVIGIEGYNEPDFYTKPGDTPTVGDHSGTRAFQRQLYDAAKASASNAKPIVGPSMANWIKSGRVSPLPFDKLSLHAYSNALHPGLAWLEREQLPYTAKMIALGQSPQGTWVTETGYHNAVQSTDPLKIGLTDAVTGKYIPRLLTLNFNRMIERTFIYELLDYGTNLANSEHNYGIITNSGARKPAFWAIKNLIQLLKDTGSQSFTPGALNLTLGGNTANVHRVLLQKSTTEYFLLLWKEVPYNDPQPTASVTVNFGSTASNVTVYSSLSSEIYASQSHVNIASLPSLAVPDEVIVLKISNIAAGGTGVPAPATGPDLVITKARSVPAEPLNGQATSLYATVENRGTAATTVPTTVTMRLNANPTDLALKFHVPALVAGESVTLESKSGTPPVPATWAPIYAGRHSFSYTIDPGQAVAEIKEGNNAYLFTVPVPAARWTHSCDTISPSWVPSHANLWAVQTGGGRTFFANTHQYAGGRLTHSPSPALATDWHLDFEYSWHTGGSGGFGAYNLSLMASALYDGNGYQVRVRQGTVSNPAVPGALGKLIQLFKVEGGNPTTLLAEGPGYNLPGDTSSATFLPVRLIFDRATQSLSVYIDLDRDGVWEQSIAPVRDTSANAVNTFNQIVLSSHDEQGAYTRPKFDNISLTRGMIDLAPALYFTDPLNDLSQWSNVGSWGVASTGTFIRNSAQGAAGSPTHVFPNPLENGWTVGFDYEFAWGGTSSTLKYGANNIAVTASMLDTNGNGYRVKVRQGDSNNPALHEKVIQIYVVTSGSEAAQPIASGKGYNTPGYSTLGKPRDFKPISFTYNRATQRISVLADLNRDGVMEEVIPPVFHAAHTSFNKLVFGAVDDTSGVTPCLDNITVGLLR